MFYLLTYPPSPSLQPYKTNSHDLGFAPGGDDAAARDHDAAARDHVVAARDHVAAARDHHRRHSVLFCSRICRSEIPIIFLICSDVTAGLFLGDQPQQVWDCALKA
ncbi:unnamed protein product [Linum trigynum]|uniref:Uncharacterized protein n=1 Tax=Linum trigynum TaxID=586398 RepID=A0AAV2G0A6_9ROSI